MSMKSASAKHAGFVKVLNRFIKELGSVVSVRIEDNQTISNEYDFFMILEGSFFNKNSLISC